MKRWAAIIILATLLVCATGAAFYSRAALDIWRGQHSTLSAQLSGATMDLAGARAEGAVLVSQVADLQKKGTAQAAALEVAQSRTLQAEKQAESLKSPDRNRFLFYYTTLAPRQYSLPSLKTYLGTQQWKDGTYNVSIFDCSEMAAYFEWKLENEGFHTLIAIGNTPFSDTGRHAWLMVETEKGAYMPVEATRSTAVEWSDSYFKNYFKYERTFEDIFEALAYSQNEFDWWLSLPVTR